MRFPRMRIQSLTHVLYDLAAHPEWMQPLRDEVEALVAEHGWTKNALNKMWKLDSLLREGLRVNGIGISTSSGFLTTRAEHSHLPQRL